MTPQERALAADLPVRLAVAREHARATGALLPVQVETAMVEDAGVAFRVEWMSSLAMKDLMSKIPRIGDKPKDDNPFLPFEADLHVADLSETHVAILNKFPSFPGHFLIITRAFAEQEAPLERADFAACVTGLAGVGGFLFFNSGPQAGASQRHRHLQIIEGFQPPIEAAFGLDRPAQRDVRTVDLPFAHYFRRFEGDDLTTMSDPIAALSDAVEEGCEVLGLAPDAGKRPPYNLLATRRWMLMMQRRVEAPAGLSLSALSYSGLMGLRQPDQLETVCQEGPMSLLRRGVMGEGAET